MEKWDGMNNMRLEIRTETGRAQTNGKGRKEKEKSGFIKIKNLNS